MPCSARVLVALVPLLAGGCRKLERLELQPVEAQVARTRSLRLAATGVYSNGAREDVSSRALWSSDAPQRLVVSPEGLATAVDEGTVSVLARLEEASATARVTVTPAPASALGLSSVAVTLRKPNDEAQLEATATEVDGKRVPVTAEAEWTTDSPAVTVDAGRLTAVVPGVAVVTASARGHSATAKVVVESPHPVAANPCARDEKVRAEVTFLNDGGTGTARLVSWKFDALSEDARAQRRSGMSPLPDGLLLPVLLPAEASGPCDKPHYGLGGFRMLLAEGRLPWPARFSMEYSRAETEKLDVSHVAMYRWNEATQDWERVESTHDAANRTVTATISDVGTYTLAPSMPAGRIGLVERARGQRRLVTAGPLRTNDGRTVPDGTLYTVALFEGPVTWPPTAPGVLSRDASPHEAGVQVAARNGSFTFEVDAKARARRLIVFSVTGTALGALGP